MNLQLHERIKKNASLKERVQDFFNESQLRKLVPHSGIWSARNYQKEQSWSVPHSQGQMNIVVWAALGNSTDEILEFLCKKQMEKSPNLRTTDGVKSIVELLLDAERYNVMHRLLMDKSIRHNERIEDGTTVEHLILRLRDKNLQQKLLNACRHRTPNSDVPKQAYGDVSVMLNDPESFNVFVTVEGQEFGFHNAVVIERSSYFEKMLSSRMKEARTRRITLQQHLSVETFTWIREVMYKGSSKFEAPEDVVEALQTAGWMGLAFVAKGLVKYIVDNITSDNFWSIVAVAYRLDCIDLLEECLEWSQTCPGLYKDLMMQETAMHFPHAAVYLTRALMRTFRDLDKT